MAPGIVDVSLIVSSSFNMLQNPNLLQLTGVLFLKEPAHQIVENNYKFADSYFYSLEQRGQKSFHRVFDEIPNGPNLTDLYFPDGILY